MLKMPEKRKESDIFPYKFQFEKGWNACHDQWLAYYKQEILRARIEELKKCLRSTKRLEKLYSNCYCEDSLNRRVVALQAELKKGA